MSGLLTFRQTGIAGCVSICATRGQDVRGVFSKPFAASAFAAQGMSTQWQECFWNESRRGVIRGFHFQVPPHEHDKLVICVSGEIFDVALDIRVGSPSYGQVHATTLRASSAENALYLPHGIAHAFQALSESATVAYLVSSEHAAHADAGIRWDSVDVSWPLGDPVVSDRDQRLPTIDEFQSPFSFDS